MRRTPAHCNVEKLLSETTMCSYCGLCEWVCPVFAVAMMRNYSPRGRVNTVIFFLRDGLWTEEGLRGVYSCLLCGACNTQCPAGIDVANVMRDFRYYLRATEVLRRGPAST